MSKKTVLFISAVFFLLLYFLFDLVLVSNYLYPDSFYYIINARYSLFGDINLINSNIYTADFFTLLKPLTSYVVSIMYIIKLAPGYINTFLLIFGLLITWQSKTTRQKPIPIIITSFILIFVNGATWYFLNRYVSEFIVFALLCLVLNTWYYQNKLFHFYYIIIVLLRPEWIICYPIFFLKKSHARFPFLGISMSSLYLLYAGFIAWQSENINLFFSHLFLPIILVWIGVFILQKYMFLWLKYFPFLLSKLLLLGKITLIVSLLTYVLSLTTSYGLWLPIRGIVLSILLMLPLWFAVVRFIDPYTLSNDDDKIEIGSIMLIIIILAFIFWITASDSFRYYLIITPLLLRLALFNHQNIRINLKDKALWLLWGLSILIIIFVLPWGILTRNYWLNRFHILDDITKDNVLVISSTPIITLHLGYKSDDICHFSPSEITTNTLIVLDDYTSYKCHDKYLQWQDWVNNKKGNIYKTTLQVEIERYRASSQTSYFYSLESE